MSLLDFLQGQPSAEERYAQYMGLMSMLAPEAGPAYTSGTSSSSNVGSYYADTETDQEGRLVPGPAGSQRHLPADYAMRGQGTPATPGETQEPYLVWDRPFTGEVPNLVTRQGVTLQRGPMRSLVDIARESGILPGIQEIGEIGGGFRTHEAQAAADATNPYATSVGNSFHEQGLAIDAGWWSARQRLARALQQAGWNLPMPGYEDWHWSYGVSG